ncbi:MAG TPA: hypothetical protein IAA66_08640 [Candidatus Avichristensenella intestinipullorum]|uniref:4Fe-4S ferredoxin-type domain-containing protein n=1 Tax=Candidatus Avichristensenella intestinipullorum TaxID=2840693 RepID=A0A9D0YX06_9FIRM|nr:hypothetical protein [Candidatus Avichristensenella intestinipullorum]
MCGREALEMARAFGFEGAALAPVRGPVAYAPNAEAVRQGIVAQPDALMPGARSVLVLAVPFSWFAPWPDGHAEVSAFYFASQRAHLALRALADALQARGVRVQARQTLAAKVWGMRAGLGVQGRNTLLKNDVWGSRFALRTLVCDLPAEDAPPDPLPARACGDCRRCVEACPTGALDGRGNLATERCLRAHMLCGAPVPEPLRALMGARLLGCEICQRVCPANASAACVPPDAKPFALETLLRAQKADLLPIAQRIGANEARAGRLRAQAALAAGNSGDASLIPLLRALVSAPTQAVAEHARWALARMENKHGEERLC